MGLEVPESRSFFFRQGSQWGHLSLSSSTSWRGNNAFFGSSFLEQYPALMFFVPLFCQREILISAAVTGWNCILNASNRSRANSIEANCEKGRSFYDWDECLGVWKTIAHVGSVVFFLVRNIRFLTSHADVSERGFLVFRSPISLINSISLSPWLTQLDFRMKSIDRSSRLGSSRIIETKVFVESIVELMISTSFLGCWLAWLNKSQVSGDWNRLPLIGSSLLLVDQISNRKLQSQQRENRDPWRKTFSPVRAAVLE